ncbi:hypothetical protein Hte_006000 [Hypoxylon texense]
MTQRKRSGSFSPNGDENQPKRPKLQSTDTGVDTTSSVQPTMGSNQTRAAEEPSSTENNTVDATTPQEPHSRPTKSVRFADPLVEIINDESPKVGIPVDTTSHTKKGKEWNLGCSSGDPSWTSRMATRSRWIPAVKKARAVLEKLRNLERNGVPAWRETGAVAGLVPGVPRDELKIAEECIEFVVRDFDFLRKTKEVGVIKELQGVLSGHDYLARLGTVIEWYIYELQGKCVDSVLMNYGRRREEMKAASMARRAQFQQQKLLITQSGPAAPKGPPMIRGSRLRIVTNIEDVDDSVVEQPDEQPELPGSWLEEMFENEDWSDDRQAPSEWDSDPLSDFLSVAQNWEDNGGASQGFESLESQVQEGVITNVFLGSQDFPDFPNISDFPDFSDIFFNTEGS